MAAFEKHKMIETVELAEHKQGEICHVDKRLNRFNSNVLWFIVNFIDTCNMCKTPGLQLRLYANTPYVFTCKDVLVQTVCLEEGHMLHRPQDRCSGGRDGPLCSKNTELFKEALLTPGQSDSISFP